MGHLTRLTRQYGSDGYRTGDSCGEYVCTDDGRFVLARGESGPIELIDLETGAAATGPAITVMASTAGLAAVATVNRPCAVTLLTVPALAELREIPVDGPVVLLAAAEGTFAAVSHDPPVLTVLTATATHRVDLPGAASCLTVAEDGTLVALGTDGGQNSLVVVVDTASGAVLQELAGARSAITSIAVNGRAGLVAAGTGARALAWRLREGGVSRTVWTGQACATVVGVTDYGRVIAHEKAMISVNPRTGIVEWSIEHDGPALLRDGRLISPYFLDIRELNPVDGKILHTWHVRDHPTGFAASGRTLVACDGSAEPVVLPDGEDVPARLGDGHAAAIRSVSFRGSQFATLGDDLQVCVWSRGDARPAWTAATGKPGTAAVVHLTRDDVYAGLGDRVYRWSDGPDPEAVTERLRSGPTALLSVPEERLLLVATEATGPQRPGALYLLDDDTLEILAEEPSTATFRSAARRPGAPTVELFDGCGYRSVDLATLATVDEEHTYVEEAGRCSFLTPGLDLRVDTANWSPDDGRLWVFHLPSRHYLHSALPIPPLNGEPAMSRHGVLATPHRDAVRLWDVRAAVLLGVLPVPRDADAGVRLHFWPSGDGILITYRSGACFELPV